MLKLFAKRPLRQRLIALAAAYAIALSSLIASFGAASAAATDISSNPGAIFCHNAGGQPAPANDETNSKLSLDCCGVGCLMLMAALPPPPQGTVTVPRSAIAIVHSLAVAALTGAPVAKSHRSRAPPFGA